MKKLNLRVRFRAKVESLFRPKLAERNNNPYATHLPILIGIAKLIKIKRVLELGSGDNSTPIFLNIDFFSDLEHLTTLEDNPEWAKRMRDQLKPDIRFTLTELHDPISNILGEIELQGFDLIFVDNSLTAEERTKTLSILSTSNLMNTILVIHDYEIMSYQLATELFSGHYAFYAFNPATGVVWNNRLMIKSSLRKMNRVLTQNSSRIAPADVVQWKSLFEKVLNR